MKNSVQALPLHFLPSPLSPALSSMNQTGPFQEDLGRGHRKKQTERMEAGLVAENQDDDGQPKRLPSRTSHKRTRATKPCKPAATGANPFDPLVVEEASDSNDNDFEAESTDESSSDTGQELSNEEVCFILYVI